MWHLYWFIFALIFIYKIYHSILWNWNDYFIINWWKLMWVAMSNINNYLTLLDLLENIKYVYCLLIFAHSLFLELTKQHCSYFLISETHNLEDSLKKKQCSFIVTLKQEILNIFLKDFLKLFLFSLILNATKLWLLSFDVLVMQQ